MTKERVGFVGVGLMGHGMAKNILQAGHEVSVIAHRNRAPIEDLVSHGASEVTSLPDIARSATIIHICAPGSPQVEAIVAELMPHLQPDTVILDCSTSDPGSTANLAQALEAKGFHMADAPLGGTPVQAEAGELATMVGASDTIFARITPVLQSWAKDVVHLGPPSSGHKMKLLNNFLAMGYGGLYAEALAVANKSGITTQQFDSVIRGSRMDCGFYQTFMGYAVEGNVNAHKFTLTNAYKDMRYLSSMADTAGAANPVGAAVKNSYAMAVNTGGDGPQDYVPHLVDFVAKANKTSK